MGGGARAHECWGFGRFKSWLVERAGGGGFYKKFAQFVGAQSAELLTYGRWAPGCSRCARGVCSAKFHIAGCGAMPLTLPVDKGI